MNKIILIGRMTKDPEVKHLEEVDKYICNFTVAVNRKVRNNNGTFDADFIPVTVWGKTAENTAKYMKKGCLVSVVGRLQIRSYSNKDGIKKYVTEVVGEEVQFLEYKKEIV